MWGQQVVIDNRAGAGGNIGTKWRPGRARMLYVCRDKSGIMAINLFCIQGSLRPIKDFAPVCMGFFFAHMLIVQPFVAGQDRGRLIALAKAKPGAITTARWRRHANICGTHELHGRHQADPHTL